MKIFTEENWLRILFILNFSFLVAHMYNSDADAYYFCQLTIIGQILVTLNFYLSITLHEQKSNLHTKLMLSRLHLVTLSLEAVVVLGFWGLRVFFSAGIIPEGE
jgi:hypothetical protein